MDLSGEKDRFLSMLPATLEALCAMQGSPHDDTILHRLLDSIVCMVTSPEDAKSAGLLRFVDTVTKDVSSVSPSVLVLALGLAAHLVSMETLQAEQMQSVMSLYNAVQSSTVIEDSSVGAAYFSSLVTVVSCPTGLEWFEKNKIHIQLALSTLETAQSVFLLKAAENLVVAGFTKSLESSSTASSTSPPASPIATETMEVLSDALKEMKKGHTNLLDEMIRSSHVSTFHQSVGQIVSLLCDCEKFCKWKCGDEGFTSSLVSLALQHPCEKIRFSTLQSTAKLVAFMDKDTKQKFLTKEIVFPVLKLVSDGEVERSIAVAATFINHSPTSITTDALTFLKMLHQMPHNILFGQEIEGKDLAALTPVVTMAMQDRQRFSKLISSILQSLTQTKNCEGLLRLLQSASTSRDSADWSSLLSSWPGGVGPVVMGNQRLLNSLLHQLQQDQCTELSLKQCSTALKCLLQIMKRPMVESRLYSQTCAAFLNILSSQTQQAGSVETDEMREVMGQTLELLQRRLVAMQWEVRDTTLEFVRNLISALPDAWFLSLALEHHLLRDAWSCLKDGESYPRASTITMATRLVALPEWWAAFLQDCSVTEATLVAEMVELLSSDSEAFPRRAAVQFLTALFTHSFDQSSAEVCSETAQQRHKICSAMTSAMADFDWEVKVKVLEFWEKMAASLWPGEQSGSGEKREDVRNGQVEDRCEANDAGRGKPEKQRKGAQDKQSNKDKDEESSSMLGSLLEDGFGKAVLAGTEDYDTAVKQKAFQILAAVEDRVISNGPSPTKSQKLENRVQEMPQTGTTSENANDSSGMNTTSSIQQTEGSDNANKTASSSIPGDSDSSDPVLQFMHTISQLNPSHQLARLGPSADVYDQKPSSLLEDVVATTKTAIKTSDVMLLSEDEFEDADDMFVDCY